MTKKRVIIGILIALLLITGIAVNIIALQGKKELSKNPNTNNTNYEKNVDNTENKVLNTTLADVPSISDEELELNGETYNPADVQDKDGNTVTIDKEENKPMVILFWSNTEESSVNALKILQSYVEKYSEKITFLSVVATDNLDEVKPEIEKIVSENQISIPILYDTVDLSASKANNVSKIPSVVVINKNGEIINTVTVEINEDVIEANLDIISENF